MKKEFPEVLYKKSFLKNFTKVKGKQLCQSLFFNKVAGLRPATLLKKRLRHRCFLVHLAESLRTPFYRTPPSDCFCECSFLTLFIFLFWLSY